MNKVFLSVCNLVVFLTINAQDGRKWSLEECISYAIEHNLEIRQLELQEQNADIDVSSAQMNRVPDMNTNVGQSWNFGRTQTESGLYESQTLSNTNFGVSSLTPLFTGFRIPNQIAKSKLDLKAATQQLERAKEDLALNIASLFLQALFNKELLAINEEQLALTLAQVDRTKELVEVGKVPGSQLSDIKAQVANDEVAVIQAKNTLELSLLDLAQSLELERSEGFDIQSPEIKDVITEYISSMQPPDVIYSNAVAIKPAIKEQEFRLESQQKSLKIAQSAYFPSLNLSLAYGNNYFHSYSLEEGGSNRTFSNQIKDNAGQSIGLSFSIPIFNRFHVRNQVRSARLNIQSRQFALDNAKKSLYKGIRTAYLNAMASQEKYGSSEKAVLASQESFVYAQEKYEVGKISVFEFTEAKTRLLQSQSEQIQAKYNYIFRTKILDFYNGIPITL